MREGQTDRHEHYKVDSLLKTFSATRVNLLVMYIEHEHMDVYRDIGISHWNQNSLFKSTLGTQTSDTSPKSVAC